MLRWIALVLLLASSSGCAMFDDLFYDEAPVGWSQVPTGGCGMPVIANSSQTSEPELLK
jgi:hypothetical protein